MTVRGLTWLVAVLGCLSFWGAALAVAIERGWL
jgi:hypothetical protein